MKTRLLTLVILFCCLLSCGSKEETKVLRLAHGLDTNHPVHLAMMDLGKQLKITSKGKLTVKIYPSGQL
ncbi:MAG: TRAP transporter substrate-binding protein, partial [Bacteroidota bacterium]